MPTFYTVREVQTLLRLAKPDAVLAAIHAGHLEAVNVSGSPGRPTWRISQLALDKFLADRRAVPAPKVRRGPRRAKPPAIMEYF